MRGAPFLCSLLAVLLFASCALAQTLPDLSQADTLGNDLFLQSNSTGMVLVVVRNQQVFFRGYGETAPGSRQPPNPQSILRLCSLSKIFASDLLIKLAQDKLLRLDDPLQRFAPPHVKVPFTPGHPITLATLATHTSGLPREVGPAPRGTPHFTFPGYAFRWHWLPAQRLKTAPGTSALYSNVGFDLLGDALEHAAHKPYASLLAERTTGPLNMHETGFTPTPAQCARLLLGAHDQGPCTDTQPSAGSSGLYSTAADMTVWLRYLLGTAAPAIPAQNRTAQAVYILPEDLTRVNGLDHAGIPTGIGLGWIHLYNREDPAAIIEKTGGGAGFTTYIALNQARHTAIFLALTDGLVSPHIRLYQQANNLLLTLAGLPLPPPDPPRPAPTRAAPKTLRKHPHRRVK